jgi:hypothetical protein
MLPLTDGCGLAAKMLAATSEWETFSRYGDVQQSVLQT